MAIVTLADIHKSFGPEVVFDRLGLRLYAKEKVGVIGPNGSGKTTILKLIEGSIRPEAGKITRKKGLRIGYVAQEPAFEGDTTVMDEMVAGLGGLCDIQEKIQQLAEQLGTVSGAELDAAMKEYDRLNHVFEMGAGYESETKIKTTLAGLGIEPSLHQHKLSTLSGGQLSRLALAKALLPEVDLLMLDEPTNHLDLQATAWLEKFLRAYTGAVVIISHDRYLLDKLVCKIVEVENGKAIIWKGNYSNYIQTKETVGLQWQRRQQSRARMVEKTRDFIARNKNKEGMRKTARGRATRLDKLLAKDPDFLQKDSETKKINFSFAKIKSQSDLIVRCQGLGKKFGTLTLFEDLSFDLLAGQRLGIIGPNGTGKSTFVKLVLGKIDPSEGFVKLGQNLSVGYLDQHGKELDPTKTVLEEAQSARGELTPEAVRTKLGAFLFHGDDVFKQTGDISGGQRNRLMLFKLMLSAPDLLVLDEPTNNLDIPSIEMLEAAIKNYDGTVIVVSHDRFFLDRTVDSLMVMGVDELGNRSLGNFEFVTSKPVYSRYSELVAQRLAERNLQQAKSPDGKKNKRAKSSKSKGATVPKELRQFNTLSIEEIEEEIIALEIHIESLQQRFGNEQIYKNHTLLAELRAELSETQAKLELLSRAYELRGRG